MKLKILLIIMLLLPMSSLAQKVAYALFKDSTLFFNYGNKMPGGAYDVEKMVKNEFGVEVKEWFEVTDQIKTVVFDKSFKNYRPQNCSMWFLNCINLSSIKGIKENLNTSEVTDMSSMFSDCEQITSLDVSGFNTDKVTYMNEMFSFCENLTSLDVSGFNTENVTNMWGMFSFCKNLTSLDVSGFNTEVVINMAEMFFCCENLTSLDVSSFNTDNVANMENMFANCKKLTSLDVSGFNTENVSFMQGMFKCCENLTSLDVSSFNTKKVIAMASMFSQCSNLTSLDVSGFDTNDVIDMGLMFSWCKNLKTIYVGDGWSTSSIIEFEFTTDMFDNCINLIGGQGTKFAPSAIDFTRAHIDGGESNPGYFTKK